jgi:tetratricopeptide (TPR) repeat protein
MGHADDLRRRTEELTRKAFEDESHRLDKEANERGQVLAKQRLFEDEHFIQEKLEEAEEQKRREEQVINAQEEEVQRVLEQERQKKLDLRRREELALKRREDEERLQREMERRKQEELERKAAEEQARKVAEQRRQEEDERRKQEANKKRTELETIRKEEERLRKEVERQDRIRVLVSNAETFYANNDYEHALVEIAKALVNDPTNPDALEVEQKIRDAQKSTQPKTVAEKRKPKEVATLQPLSSSEQKKKKFPRYVIAAIIAAVLIIGTFITLQLRRQAFPEQVSLAVLPWTSPSGNLDEKIYGTALAEEVAARFQSVKPMTVMGFTSGYGLSQFTTTPAQASAQLGFPFTLAGTFEKMGDLYAINVKILDSVGGVVWTNNYHKKPEALADLPGEVSRQVLDALSPAASSAIVSSRPGTTNIDAYLLYLRGLEMLHRRTEEGSKTAFLLFQQAMQHDDGFADAFAAAASVLVTEYELERNLNDSILVQAQHLAEHAIAANSSLGEAYFVLGLLYAQKKQYAAALDKFDTALARLPHSSKVYLNRAKVEFKIGKYTDALSELSRAYELNPRDPDVLQTYAYITQLMGTTRKGFWYHETALFVVRDSTEYLTGPFADAVLSDPDLSLSQSTRVIEACRRRLRAQPGDYVTTYKLGRLLQISGKGMEAMSVLNTVEIQLRAETQQHPKNALAMMFLAKTLTRLGKFTEAISLAQRAAEIDKNNVEVKYQLAQVYSLQMYSSQNKSIDEKKKQEAFRILGAAITMSYRFDQLVSADFFNMVEQPEFQTAIRESLQ